MLAIQNIIRKDQADLIPKKLLQTGTQEKSVAEIKFPFLKQLVSFSTYIIPNQVEVLKCQHAYLYKTFPKHSIHKYTNILFTHTIFLNRTLCYSGMKAFKMIWHLTTSVLTATGSSRRAILRWMLFPVTVTNISFLR